ncbi:UNVERIFIED_CONTAM: Serine/threonine-protein phosphatase 6 regulatory subunit [Sesamum angustifolium]|uniref:Serine/threonine-protein phosphatase 6 regulatory subunit n=1 Tax=Sesamum angustifolium TaxID=2727405 RepID=A0AAW2PDE9_9LAMI
MAGLSTASPVETILDKENFTLEELLDEDEIIQECKALNGHLINFLREKNTVKQLIQYIVEEAPVDAEKQRTFKFPFIACEIFTCEVDIILKALVEDEELMDLLFSFLDPERPHGTLLAGYFSKVVAEDYSSMKTYDFQIFGHPLDLERFLLFRALGSFLMLSFINVTAYIGRVEGTRKLTSNLFLHPYEGRSCIGSSAHPDIINRLIDLIGITSIMEVLIRLIGADEHIYANYVDSMQWLEDMNVLEMIVDKFSSSDCPEVHANAAETLCAITRYAPPGLASKISSPSFIGRLFRHALEESRPKSVLVNLLSVCISLLDPKRLTSGTYYMYTRQISHGSSGAASPETVQGMLESLGNLLKLLDISSEDHVLLTTYGKLQPPLGKHRLKIIEFISVLVAVSSEVAEKELIRLGTVKRIFELFFEYPYNNFLHHHVEQIAISCLESKNPQLLNIFFGIPTVPAEGRSAPRIGNIGHLTRIANKLVQLGNSNSLIQTFLQENSDWVDWQTNVLLKRNAVENVFQWACGRPTALQDRTRDSDDDDYQDRDYDVAALANNLSQAFRYGIYSNDDIDEARGSLERDDEDVYFDDESAEVVISSLRLGDDQESGSLFTNSNWFAFEGERIVDEHSSGSTASSSPNTKDTKGHEGVGGADDEDLADTATLDPVQQIPTLDDDASSKLSEGSRETETSGSDNPPEWVEWRETSGSLELPPTSDSSNTSSAAQKPPLPNGELELELEGQPDDVGPDKTVASPTYADAPADSSTTDGGGSPDSKNIDSVSSPSQSPEVAKANPSIGEVDSHAEMEDSSGPAECEQKN